MIEIRSSLSASSLQAGFSESRTKLHCMKSVCFYFQVHQPYRVKRYRVFDIGQRSRIFQRPRRERSQQPAHRRKGRAQIVHSGDTRSSWSSCRRHPRDARILLILRHRARAARAIRAGSARTFQRGHRYRAGGGAGRDVLPLARFFLLAGRIRAAGRRSIASSSGASLACGRASFAIPSSHTATTSAQWADRGRLRGHPRRRMGPDTGLALPQLRLQTQRRAAHRASC